MISLGAAKAVVLFKQVKTQRSVLSSRRRFEKFFAAGDPPAGGASLLLCFLLVSLRHPLSGLRDRRNTREQRLKIEDHCVSGCRGSDLAACLEAAEVGCPAASADLQARARGTDVGGLEESAAA